MKSLLLLCLSLCSSGAFAANLVCDLDMFDGRFVSLELTELSPGSGELRMIAPAAGLIGRCIERSFELYCSSNRGDIIEIDTRKGTVRWDSDSGYSRGQADCRSR